MSDTVVDDIAEHGNLATLCEWAKDGPIPLARLAALVNGSASAMTVEAFGAGWLSALLDLAERGGVGSLERDEDGDVVFAPVALPPDFDEAWDRATR